MNKQKEPKLRFPGFTGEWQEKRLGDLIEFIPTNSYSRENLNNISGTVKNIHYGDIHKKFPIIVDVKNSEIPYLNSDIDIEKYPEQAFCKDGDLIIADASEDYADIGKAIELINVGNEKLLAGLHTFLARDEGKFAPKYKSYLFNGPQTKTKLKILAQGISVLSLSKSNLKAMAVTIPTLPEQKKIADFLSDIDTKIEKLTRKKELTEQYKKGAMQKIFSQKIRFKDENGKNYPDWEEKRLGDLVKINSGDSPSKYNFQEEGLPYFKVDQLNNSGKYQIVTPYFIDTTNHSIEKGSVIFPKRGAAILMNKIRIIAQNSYMDTNLMTLTAIKDLIDSEFLFYFILKSNLQKIADTTSIPQINNKHIEPYKIKLPCLEEQKKISDFLVDLDTRIEHIHKELVMLKEFKKGLLQRMFV